jgi:hypothetical protein
MPFLDLTGYPVFIRPRFNQFGFRVFAGYRSAMEGGILNDSYYEPGPLMAPVLQSALTPFDVFYSPRGIGLVPFTRSLEIDPTERPYYVQNDNGKLCVTRFLPRVDPSTPAQLLQRQKLIDANFAWEALPPEDKSIWLTNPLCFMYNITGRHLFLKFHMLGKI